MYVDAASFKTILSVVSSDKCFKSSLSRLCLAKSPGFKPFFNYTFLLVHLTPISMPKGGYCVNET